MEKLDINNIEKLLHSEPSEKLLLKALKDLKVKEKDRKSRLLILLICIALGLTVGFCGDTVIIMQESIDAVLNALLALFGVIFTGYALLQAFMNKQLLIQLLTDIKVEKDCDKKTRLQDVNENFVFLMLLQFIGIIIALVAKIALFCIPNNAQLFSSPIVNNIGAGFLCVEYFFLNGIILWRTVAFIASIFQLFNAYAVAQIIEILDEEEKKK